MERVRRAWVWGQFEVELVRGADQSCGPGRVSPAVRFLEWTQDCVIGRVCVEAGGGRGIRPTWPERLRGRPASHRDRGRAAVDVPPEGWLAAAISENLHASPGSRALGLLASMSCS